MCVRLSMFVCVCVCAITVVIYCMPSILGTHSLYAASRFIDNIFPLSTKYSKNRSLGKTAQTATQRLRGAKMKHFHLISTPLITLQHAPGEPRSQALTSRAFRLLLSSLAMSRATLSTRSFGEFLFTSNWLLFSL